MTIQGTRYASFTNLFVGSNNHPKLGLKGLLKYLKLDGYSQCQADHTLFVKHSTNGKLAILIVYVDGIVVTGNHEEKISHLKHLLSKEFEIKDLGHLRYFLGMEVARSSHYISVSQRKLLDLLRETGMSGCKPVETPMDPNIKLEACGEGIPVDREKFQRLVGKLIYLTHTRPDISFVVSKVSQFPKQSFGRTHGSRVSEPKVSQKGS